MYGSGKDHKMIDFELTTLVPHQLSETINDDLIFIETRQSLSASTFDGPPARVRFRMSDQLNLLALQAVSVQGR
jgi:hypothetical protein